MKKCIICLVMLVSVLALGFAQARILGTYRYGANVYITFTSNEIYGDFFDGGGSFNGSWNRTSTMSGTFGPTKVLALANELKTIEAIVDTALWRIILKRFP